jgi:linoleoyl-CoA desaturase
VSFLVGGSWVFFTSTSLPIRIAGLLVSTLGSVGIGSNTHTASHYATASRRGLNEALLYFGYPFCLGFSACYWSADHLTGHHIAPNVVGKDNDFEYSPFFAITESDIESAGPLMQRYHRHLQLLAFLMFLPLFGFNLQRCGILHLLNTRAKWNSGRKQVLFDSLCLVGHLAVFLVLPSLLFGIKLALIAYALRIGLMSICMFAILAPAHLVPEAPILTQEEFAELGHCAAQTLTTVNYRGGPMVRWYAAGLDYQIEHHLFPEICHVYYPEISPLVQEFCRDHNLPYRWRSFSSAVYEAVRVFSRPKPVGYSASSE